MTPASGASASVGGALLALFLLTGRWSLDRVLGTDLGLLGQPAVWVVVATLVWAATRMGPIRLRGGVAWLLACLAWAAVSVLWSPSPSALVDKLSGVILLLIMVAALEVGVARRDLGPLVQGLWSTVLLAGGGLLALAVLSGKEGRLAVLGGGPNVFVRTMGAMIVAAAATGARVPAARLPLGFLAVFAALGAVRTESRGGMLAILCACAVLVATPGRTRASALRWLGGMALAVGVAAALDLVTPAREVIDHRFFKLTLQEGYASDRDVLALQAWALFREAPVAGQGHGSFFLHTGRDYPHNIFLELACETGLVGVALFVAAVTSIFALQWKARRDPSRDLLALWVLYLVAAQFSGDLFDSRAVFVLPVLLRERARVHLEAPPPSAPGAPP